MMRDMLAEPFEGLQFNVRVRIMFNLGFGSV